MCGCRLHIRQQCQQKVLYEIWYILNKDVTSLGDNILSKNYKVHINSGRISTGLIFEDEVSRVATIPYRNFKLKDFGYHVIRAAINRFNTFRYSELKVRYPNLISIKEFIESDCYLSGINVQIFADAVCVHL